MIQEIWCRTCGRIVQKEPRRVVGCNCDPDAPTWCCINEKGEAWGLSGAKYEELS